MKMFSTTTQETIGDFLPRQGIGDKTSQRQWFDRGLVKVNGELATRETLLNSDDTFSIESKTYQVTPSHEPGRLAFRPNLTDDGRRIHKPIRVQCGYHKCLTMYFKRITKKTAIWNNPLKGQFRHFFHRADEFYHDCQKYNISSVSGNCLNLERFDDIRAVHIIRDPRDMIISGYFYHKRASEIWCEYVNPTNEDWKIVNAPVPSKLPPDLSFADYLSKIPLEEGLYAEIEFRKNHFESMLSWPNNDERVLTVKYEDIIGNESQVFGQIYDFYNFSFHTKLAAKRYADRYSLKSKHKDSGHIRNPKHGQWKQHFTPELTRSFNDQYGDLLEKYGYEPS